MLKSDVYVSGSQGRSRATNHAERSRCNPGGIWISLEFVIELNLKFVFRVDLFFFLFFCLSLSLSLRASRAGLFVTEDLYQFMDPHQRMLVDPDQIEHDQYLVYAPWNPDQLLDHLQATNREIDRRELKSNLQHRRDMEVASDDAKTETAEPEEVLETAEPEEVLGSDPVAAREATSPHAPVEPEKPDHRTSKVESLSQGEGPPSNDGSTAQTVQAAVRAQALVGLKATPKVKAAPKPKAVGAKKKDQKAPSPKTKSAPKKEQKRPVQKKQKTPATCSQKSELKKKLHSAPWFLL